MRYVRSTFALLLGWGALVQAEEGNLILDAAKQHIGVTGWDKPMGAVRTPGKGVCTDLILDVFTSAGIDLADSIRNDVRLHPSAYVFAEGAAIDTRRARVQIDWFLGHAQKLSTKTDFRPGDIVFYAGTYRTDGSADHVAIVSDSTSAEGTPYIIDNFPPTGVSCTRLVTFAPYTSVRLIGHFRYPPVE